MFNQIKVIMKKGLFISVIALSALMVSCNKQQAQSEQKDEIAAPASQSVSALRTAMDLAKYGYEVKSASALIEAADILASTPTQKLDATIERGEENANETEKVEKNQPTVDQLLADARELALEDATLLAMADKVTDKQNNLTRGAVDGPFIDCDRVPAHGYVTYTLAFRANEIAEIVVSGDGDTDLDLYVYDENGNLGVSDTDYTDDCYVRFYPKWTGYFRVKIVNRGGVYNNYAIITN